LLGSCSIQADHQQGENCWGHAEYKQTIDGGMTHSLIKGCTASHTQKPSVNDETEFLTLPGKQLVNQVKIAGRERDDTATPPHNDSGVDPVNLNDLLPVCTEGFAIEQDKDQSLTIFFMR